MPRVINCFKPITSKASRIEYSDAIKAAVLDPRIHGLRINMNGGYDYVDRKYGFIKLLLSRGQVSEIQSGQDLFACDDYVQAAFDGNSKVSILLEARTTKGAYASSLRIERARAALDEKIMLTRAVLNSQPTKAAQ